jgi:pre-mRNA-splicing factor SPF27
MSSYSIDALPYYDKQVEVPGTFARNLLLRKGGLTRIAAKAAAQALIEAELRHTQQIAGDDPRLPPDVAVFPVSQSGA